MSMAMASMLWMRMSDDHTPPQKSFARTRRGSPYFATHDLTVELRRPRRGLVHGAVARLPPRDEPLSFAGGGRRVGALRRGRFLLLPHHRQRVSVAAV